MQKHPDGTVVVSATDLVGYPACDHLATLELGRIDGLWAKPFRDDPELALMQEAIASTSRSHGRAVWPSWSPTRPFSPSTLVPRSNSGWPTRFAAWPRLRPNRPRSQWRNWRRTLRHHPSRRSPDWIWFPIRPADPGRRPAQTQPSVGNDAPGMREPVRRPARIRRPVRTQSLTRLTRPRSAHRSEQHPARARWSAPGRGSRRPRSGPKPDRSRFPTDHGRPR